jgi:hypothetical protein
VLYGDLGVKPFLTGGSLGSFQHHEGGASSLKILLYPFFLLARKLESLLVKKLRVLDLTVIGALQNLLFAFDIF